MHLAVISVLVYQLNGANNITTILIFRYKPILILGFMFSMTKILEIKFNLNVFI